MSANKQHNSLLTDEDRNFHNLPKNEQPGFVDINGQLPHVENYWTPQPPQPYWDPSMQQMPYGYYAPMPYYQEEYRTPTPVMKAPVNKPTTPLSPAPLGHIPQDITYSAPAIIQHSVAPVPNRRTVPVRVSNRRAVAIPVPVRHRAPPPHYRPRSPPSPRYYSRRSPSPRYYIRRSPPPYDYYERERLPYIPRRDRRDERDYYDRYRYEDPIVIGYIGRRHNDEPYERTRRWYH